MPGAVTCGVDMDELQWSMLVEWTARLGAWILAAAAVRRPEPVDSYGALSQMLRQLPAGSQASGTLSDGTTWCVRIPPIGHGERRDDH
jgi:hypothetical protein